MQVIAYYDYLLLLPYGILFYFIVRRYLKKITASTAEYRWLMIAWFIKMFACILYAWMIVYYYGYGDPITYYNFGDELRAAVVHDFSNIKFFFQGAQTFKVYAAFNSANLASLGDLGYFNGSNFIIHKLSCLGSFFTFNRFLIISFLFTNISYFGFVIIYNTIKKIAGHFQKQIIIGCLFIPSCVFWSSGLAKEPICIFSLAILFSLVVNVVLLKKISIYYLIKFVFYVYILLTVKTYLFVCLAISLAFWLFYRYIKSTIIKVPFLKFIYFFFLVLFCSVAIYFWGSTIADIITENGSDIVMHNSSVYRSIAENGGGSLIQVSDIDVSSLSGILKFVPLGLVNVFFRPWPWEISNILMILTVLENLFLLIIFIKVVFKTRFFTRNLFINYDFQVFVLVFSISLALIIGISTFNFGTMVRYKIPFLPFWACFLLIKNAQSRKTNIIEAHTHAYTTQ